MQIWYKVTNFNSKNNFYIKRTLGHILQKYIQNIQNTPRVLCHWVKSFASYRSTYIKWNIFLENHSQSCHVKQSQWSSFNMFYVLFNVLLFIFFCRITSHDEFTHLYIFPNYGWFDFIAFLSYLFLICFILTIIIMEIYYIIVERWLVRQKWLVFDRYNYFVYFCWRSLMKFNYKMPHVIEIKKNKAVRRTAVTFAQNILIMLP
jgi:hypothetical protein